MKRRKLLLLLASLLMTAAFCLTAHAAATYSSAWYQSGNNWYIRGANGQMITNAWVCDNAVGPGNNNTWYLIDAGGNMVSAPLVQDGTGHYYSLETQHNGYYGMLRYNSGTYDGIYLNFSQNHDGSFGAITNQDGINALIARYGVYSVAHINNNNCIYTASYINNQSNPSSPGTSTTYKINYYVDGKLYTTRTSSSRSTSIPNSYPSNLLYWEEASTGERYYPGDGYVFSGGRTTTRMNGVTSYTPTPRNMYELNFYKAGNLEAAFTQPEKTFTVVASPGDYNGMPFMYWEDDYGNHWDPGEIFTAKKQCETMVAIYNPFADGPNREY